MRISGGLSRGIPLEVPKGIEIRPATEANRERLFSSIGDKVRGASFLDLFAGTGSYGLEALSRGAEKGKFVENHKKAITSLKKNLIAVCKSAQINQKLASIDNRDVKEFVRSENETFDLIFLDPPYPLFPVVGPMVLEKIRENKMLKKNGLLFHEATPDTQSDFDGWHLTRTIGKTKKGSPLFRVFSTVG